VEPKVEPKVEHKTEPKAMEVKVVPASELQAAENKDYRKSSARPSVIPGGATAGKPAPEDWLVKVQVIKGTDLRKAALFGTIDPFCEVTVAGNTSLTPTRQQTENPEWQSRLNFFGEAGSTLPEKLHLVVRDSNKYTAATVVGEADVDLKTYWEKGTGLNGPIELTHKAKPAGKIFLQITCLFETASQEATPAKPTS